MPSEIQNGNIRTKISEEFGFTNPMLSPRVIPDYVVPCLMVNDDLFYNPQIAEHGTAINSISTTILTTDSNYQTWITSASLNVIKDVTSTSVLTSISVVINGKTKPLLSIPGLTLTVQTGQTSVSFSKPILIDRSSLVTITNSTATGNITASGTVTGFLRPRN